MNLKTPKEIRLIEKACQLTDKTFDYILGEIKPGITEKELSLKIQRFIRKNNALLSFRPIVAFGKNSREPHHKTTNKKLKKGQIVLLDFGAKFQGYCADMTRTVFFGKATSKQRRIYQTVLAAQKQAIELLYSGLTHYTPGFSAKDVDKVARDYIISKGFKPMSHGLGHGIGKKVHENPRLSPKSKALLKSEMAFTVQPGIYIKTSAESELKTQLS